MVSMYFETDQRPNVEVFLEAGFGLGPLIIENLRFSTLKAVLLLSSNQSAANKNMNISTYILLVKKPPTKC